MRFLFNTYTIHAALITGVLLEYCLGLHGFGNVAMFFIWLFILCGFIVTLLTDEEFTKLNINKHSASLSFGLFILLTYVDWCVTSVTYVIMMLCLFIRAESINKQEV